MQGLAFVQQKRIVAVSALEATAQSAAAEGGKDERVASWIDAHRGDVFSALYRITDEPPFTRGRLVEIDPPSVGEPSRILNRWISAAMTPDIFSGDGVSRFAPVVQPPGRRAVELPLLAGPIGLIAIDRARAGESVEPGAVQPLYVRRPDAEVAREQREVEQGRETR
jgi:tRNA A37 threonylcarbamoyladenosine modification protein TsaB